MVSLIAVIGKNRELGRDNKLIWNLPDDLQRFSKITSGHPVIMGRKTYESIGHPLMNRHNIVVTSNPTYLPSGVSIVHSLNEATNVALQSKGSDEIFVIGGGSIYALAIHLARRLYLTVVEAQAPDADVFFPDYSRFNHVISQELHTEGEYQYTYFILEPSTTSEISAVAFAPRT